MRHPFDLDDFESFLSEQSDKHRMYAGDQVWRNIQDKLHGKDRWPALTFGSILTIAIIAVGLTLYYPHKNLMTNEPFAIEGNKTVSLSAHTSSEQAENPIDLTVRVPKTSSLQIETKIFFNTVSGEENKLVVNDNSNSKNLTVALSNGNSLDVVEGNSEEELLVEMPIMEEKELVKKTNSSANFVDLEASFNKNIFVSHSEHFQIQPLLLQDNPTKTNLVFPDLSSFETAGLEIFKKNSLAYGPAKSKAVPASKSKLALQLYATPSISYRYLLEDRSFTANQLIGPLAPNITNSVNAFVRHQPKMGLEIGGALLFKVSDNFRFKTGLQFNYRQFGISAYSLLQYEPALFALNGTNGVDSMINYTRISAQNGQSPLDLTSNFFQVAVPVGFDMKISQVKNVDFYVSASGQLTYNLSSSSYLLSTDFKKYVQQPHALDRRFNINTAVEAFASFELGGVTWQAGPQIRYQMLPGSKSAYPIREHLIDYGIKIGVVKTLK